MSQADPSQLHPIGKVAALNIVRALELSEKDAPKIERAIADEIQAMSSHFTLAMADVQTQYEVEVLKIKSTYSFIDAHKLLVNGVLVGVFLLGAIVGHFV